jgi:hypothetical protein
MQLDPSAYPFAGLAEVTSDHVNTNDPETPFDENLHPLEIANVARMWREAGLGKWIAAPKEVRRCALPQRIV